MPPEPSNNDPIPLPTTYAEAMAQVNEATRELDTDYSDRVALPWRGLAEMVGPILPRDLWIVGARPSNGKSTFCMALFDFLVTQRIPTLYIGAGAEGPTKDLRRQWAALRLGMPVDAVLENRWKGLPPDAHDQLYVELNRQAVDDHEVAMFADVGEQLTTKSLAAAFKTGYRDGMQYVILDHIHRIKFNEGADKRSGLADATEWMRNMAARHELGVIVAAQLKRSSESGPLRDLIPPTESDLAECGSLERDAVVILLLHRTRKAGVTKQDVEKVLHNERPASDVIAENTMAVKIGKHRRRGRNKDRTAFLEVHHTGRLIDQPAAWHLSPPSRPEREPGDDEQDPTLPF